MYATPNVTSNVMQTESQSLEEGCSLLRVHTITVSFGSIQISQFDNKLLEGHLAYNSSRTTIHVNRSSSLASGTSSLWDRFG